MNNRPDKHSFVSGTHDWRGAVRVPVRATISAVKRDKEVNGQIADLSITGIFVDWEKCFDVGEAVLIKMCIAEGGSLYDIIVHGTVVRHSENGMGIQFDNLNRISRDQIKGLVERLQ